MNIGETIYLAMCEKCQRETSREFSFAFSLLMSTPLTSHDKLTTNSRLHTNYRITQ